MKIEELKTKNKILIIGYGIEGKAVHEYLKKHCPDSKIGIADKNAGDNYLEKQKNYDLAIKSPGVNPSLVKIPYTTATNIFFSNHKGKTIAVTGTKGKSTTAVLIYEMCKLQRDNVYLGGNIGECAINFLDQLNDQSLTVLELSSFQLQDIKYSPNVAVMLMITADHLDYHRDINSYVDAKRNILRFQTKDDSAIINRDYPASNESDVYTEGKVFYVSREREVEEGCFVKDGKVVLRVSKVSKVSRVSKANDTEIIKTSEILLPGRHNLENVCAAVMAAKIAGVQTKNIVQILKTFRGLEHRLEFVSERYGIQFYNDSLSTIPDAAIEAIESFDGRVETLIAGGFDRGVNYTEFGKYLAKSSVRNLILFMPAGEKIWEAIVAAGGEERIKKYDAVDMHQAVFLASEETESGKICLMSPAAASFGMFKNYKDRGEQFKKEVNSLT